MSWTNLKATISAAIKGNDNQEITGPLLKGVLNAIVNNLGANAQFAGIATPETRFVISDGPIFWMTTEAGTYNLNGETVIVENATLAIFIWDCSTWSATLVPISGVATVDQMNTAIASALTPYYTKSEVNVALGDKVDKVTGKSLSTNDYTNAEKAKLAELENYDDTQVRQLINEEKAARQQGDNALCENITQEETRAKGVEQTLQLAIDVINGKMPAQATAQNQLADKEFVNSSISTATADFKGTYNSLQELEQVTANANDYAFVIATDMVGNIVYKRYKWVESTGWSFEYDLNNSSFTAAQWAAIQSGITAALVTKLTDLPTNTELNQRISTGITTALGQYYTKSEIDEALGGKQNTIDDLANIRSGAQAGSTAVQPSTLNNAVKNTVAESGVYDVSANNDNTKFESLSALLSSANLNTLIPTDIRKGGMSIKFVLSSDNKYVQFRYMETDATTAATFTNVANWQGVDDEPTADSGNLVKSGGVVSGISVGANTVINGSRERFFEVGNLYNKSTSAHNIIDNTGSEIESNYIHSDYIPVYKGVQYVFSYLLSTPGGFYDESKNWISKLPNNSGSTINEATFIPKQNGYVRINLSANDDNYIVTFGNKIPEDILPYGTCTNNKAFFNINQITDFGNFSPLKGQYGNLFNKDTISPGLININGSITESDTYSYSDYIAVKKGNTYIATSLFSSAGGFYDTNKNWVSNIPNRSSYGDYKIFVIEQDGYVRVNLYTSRKDTFILSIGTELRDYPVGDKLICPKLIINKNQIEGSRWEGKKLVCIGDSITDAGTWVDTLGTMLGTITYNRGKSGSSFAKNPNRQDSFCHRADLPASDEAGHGLGFPTEADLVFVLGGVNDWGMDLPTGAENAAIDTNTTCGAIHYLIRNLKDRYPNAKIVFGIPYRIWSPTEAFPSWNEITFNDANDETTGFEYRTNTSGKTFDQIRQSIEKICSMYGIGTISLLNCGFSFWKTTDREMYSLQRELHDVTINGDGLHPSEAGSNVIAKYLCNELNLLAL